MRGSEAEDFGAAPQAPPRLRVPKIRFGVRRGERTAEDRDLVTDYLGHYRLDQRVDPQQSQKDRRSFDHREH
jgi:hypothetical protein